MKVDQIIIYIVYCAIMILIGLLVRGRTKSLVDYYLGGRKLGTVLLVFTYVGALISSFSLVGNPGSAYAYGVQQFWTGGTMVLISSVLAFIIVGPKWRDVTVKLKALSIPEYLEARYESKVLRLFASAFYLYAFAVYTVVVYFALGRVLEYGLGIPYTWAIVVATLVTIAYTAVGGFWGVVYTDVIQSAIFTFGAIFLTVLVLVTLGGLTGLADTLAQVNPALVMWPYTTVPTSLGWMDLPLWFWIGHSMVFIALTIPWFFPHTTVKWFAMKDVKVLRWAPLLIAAFLTIDALGNNWILGLGARALVPGLRVSDWAIVALSEKLLPPLLSGLIVAGIAAGAMSTVNAFYLLMSQHVVYDIYRRFIRPSADEAKLLRWSKIVVVVIGLALLYPSLYPPDLVIIAFRFVTLTFGIAFLVPMVVSLFWKEATKWGALSCMIVGIIIPATFYLASHLTLGRPAFCWSAIPYVFGFPLAALIFYVMSKLTQKSKPTAETLAKIFGESS